MEDRESEENIHGSLAKLSLLEDVVDMSATCTLLNHLFVISDFGMYAFPVVARINNHNLVVQSNMHPSSHSLGDQI